MSNGEAGTWCQWTPGNAESVAYSDVVEAVRKFESVDTDAGRAATDWLRHHALVTHPATITYVCVVDDRIGGFFALTSSAITLSQAQRKAAGPSDRNYMTHPTQGASLISWLAKHHDGDTPARTILYYAVNVALRVARMQGTPLLVLDAYDEEVAVRWEDRYGFRPGPRTPGGKLRLWLPLDPR